MATVKTLESRIAVIMGDEQMMQDSSYEGASSFDRSLALWHPAIQSADSALLPGKELADARTQDIVRNDAIPGGGVRLHKDSIVGSLYLLNAKPRTKVLGMDDTWAHEFQEEVESKFITWAESYRNWPDAARRNTFTDLIRLATGVYVTSGEFLATVEWRSSEKDRPYYTALQPIELNRLSTPFHIVPGSQNVRGGVRMSASGVPLGYYIRRAEKGSNIYNLRDFGRWHYIRARGVGGRTQVIHVMEQDRPSQTRGISQMVSALKELHMLKRFRDVTLQNAVVNATFAAAIESELPSAQVFEAIGGGDVGTSVVNYAQKYLGAISAYSGSARNMQIDGVKIPHLMPGTKLNLSPLGNPGGVGTEFEASFIRYLAASLDVSYEELAHDWTKTTYSGGRAAANQQGRSMRARKRSCADKVAGHMYQLWFEETVNAGEIETMKGSSVPNMYDGLYMEAFTNAEWIGAGPGQIDELKETQAAILRLKMGMSTYEREVSRFGHDWRDTFQQTQREKEAMERMGITPNEMMDLGELDTTNRDGDGDDGNRQQQNG